MEVKRRTAQMLVEKVRWEATRGEALRELRLMSKHDDESRALVSEAGAIPFLAESLHSSSAESQDNAAATLLNLSISSLIGFNRDMAHALIEIVGSPRSAVRSVKDGLKALFGISLHRPNRAALVELGAVEALFSLVVEDGREGVVEDATAVIAQVAGCEESGEAFGRVSGIEVLVDLVKGSTGRIMENALSAMLNLARCGGAAAEQVREMGMEAVDGIADVAEKGSARGKSKAVALLKLLHDGHGHSNKLTDSSFHSMY